MSRNRVMVVVAALVLVLAAGWWLSTMSTDAPGAETVNGAPVAELPSRPSRESARSNRVERGQIEMPSEPTRETPNVMPVAGDAGSFGDAGAMVDAGVAPVVEDANLVADGDATWCSMNTKFQSSIDLENDCEHSVDLSWVDFDCRERSYSTVAPHERHAQPTFVSHVWRVRDHETQRLLQQVAPISPVALRVHACSDKTVRLGSVTDAGSAAPRMCMPAVVKGAEPQLCSISQASPPATIHFTNNCQGVSVQLWWLNADCREISYGALAPGEERTQKTFSGHTWRLRDSGNGALYAEITPRAPLLYELLACACEKPAQ